MAVTTTQRASGRVRLRSRTPFLLLGLFALLAGLWAGLLRLGLPLPVFTPPLPEDHGPLMVLGFLGTLISLERAVALGRRWAYVTPLAAGGGMLVMLLGAPAAGRMLLLVAGLTLVANLVVVGRIQPALHVHVMTAAAACWAVAAVLWLAHWDVDRLVPWLMGFLVLTITGERLELARFGRISRSDQRLFLLSALPVGVGLLVGLVSEDAGPVVVGLGLVALAAWLGRFDIARRTVRTTGLTRYMAACLLAGYVWLGAAGVLWLAGGSEEGLVTHDAALHMIFLGFVMSMVFAHAPVIVPAVLRAPVPYHRVYWVHVVLLHAGLALRVAGGIAGWLLAWQIGGIVNETAILLFLGVTAVASARAARRRASATTES